MVGRLVLAEPRCGDLKTASLAWNKRMPGIHWAIAESLDRTRASRRSELDLGSEGIDAVNHHAQQEGVMVGEVPSERFSCAQQNRR